MKMMMMMMILDIKMLLLNVDKSRFANMDGWMDGWGGWMWGIVGSSLFCAFGLLSLFPVPDWYECLTVRNVFGV